MLLLGLITIVSPQPWRRTFFSHVHVVNLPVSIFGLADATVREGVAGVVRIHTEVEVMTGVRHRQLKESTRKLEVRNDSRIKSSVTVSEQ